MNQVQALKRLQALGPHGFETRDASALLSVTSANANMILRRLERAGMLVHVSRGRWLSADGVHPFALPELITAPSPAYVSLQSALFHHGLIEQIPALIYAVTLARPRSVRTPLGMVSLHRMTPDLFLGFELHAASGAKIATAEKALFDVLYLAPARSRLFAALPEVEIPRRFKWARVRELVERVKSEGRRTLILRAIERLRS